MRKEEKQRIIEWVQSATAHNETVIFSQFNGLTVAATENLRDRVRKSGACYRVVKNTLLERALADKVQSGTLDEILVGTTSIAISTDPVSLAKLIKEYSKEFKALTVKGTLLDGRILSAEDTLKLAEMPSKEQLLGQLAGMLMQPMTNLASVLSAPLRDLASVLTQLKDRKAA